MPVRLQLRDKARGKYGLCRQALNDIMCSCLWSEYLWAMKLSETRSLTMMNGNEMDMALSFIPLLRGFVVPRVFLQSCLARLSSPLCCSQLRLLGAFRACWWGRWNFRFVCSSLYLFCRGQIALFVCSSFWWLEIIMEKWIIGSGGIFLYCHPFISCPMAGQEMELKF